MEHSSQLFHPNTCLISMGFVAVSTLIKTHFHVFPPTPTWNLYLPTWNCFNTHRIWNTHFSLGTSTPSSNSCCGVEFPVNCSTLQVYVFLLTLSILIFQFQHLNCPKITNTKRNYYQGITNYRVSNLTKPINLKC